MSTAIRSVWNDAPPPVRSPFASVPVIRIPMGRRSPESAGAAQPKMGCAFCAMRKVCVSSDLSPSELDRFENGAHARRRVKAGEHLYRSGDASASLYAIRSGFLMTSTVTDDGREQVTGFHMLGEVIGIDMIGGGVHASDAIALEDTEICEISSSTLENLSHDIPALRHRLYRMIGEQFHQEREVMLLLGSMRAEDRVASFLLNLGRRYAARGFSAVRYLLRMSRAEIGSYLGLRLETVSRLLSKFQAEGLLQVDSRSVNILDPHGLKQVIGRSLN